MEENGFVNYNLVEPVCRPVDMALWQMDAVFIGRDGPFRQFEGFVGEVPVAVPERK